MKAIQARDLKDSQWELFADLLNELNARYSKDKNAKPVEAKKNKSEVLSDLELLNNDLANHYIIFDKGKAAGWYARRLLGTQANFVFDALYDEIPAEFLKPVFSDLIKFISDTDKNYIYTSSKDSRIINAMIKSGAVISDKAVYSGLMRKNIDRDNLNSIISSISDKISYRLELYNEVTEDIFERYLNLYNEVRADMNFFNPEKPEIKKRSRESLKIKLKYDKGPRDQMYMYVLFDGEEIAAFCSVYIRDENRNVIDHCGGLTAVNRKYRGQNLAKFLKAKMYLKMFEAYPDFEYIRTDTYPWNEYMYRINQEMGFVPIEEYTELKISKESLKNFINNKCIMHA